MESRAKILGHPIHPMLIPFPLGLLGMAVVFDIINRLGGSDTFSQSAHYMIAAGIITGLVAAVFGLIDWLAIPEGTRAKRIGLFHGAGNAVVILLFIVAWFLRRDDASDPSALVLVLEVIAAGLAMVSGWLGGELVDRLGVGVDPGAHLDSPSSLSGEQAGRS